MAEVFHLADYPFTVYGSLENPIRISPGSGQAYVDGVAIDEPVVVTKAVSLSGHGTVSTGEAEAPKKPRAKRPSEIKAAEEKKVKTSTAKAKVTRKKTTKKKGKK